MMPAEHEIHDAHQHDHGPGCGHASVQREGHTDYVHEGHAHTPHEGHYDEGRRSVWIKAPDGAQEALIESNPDRFYRPKYVGPSGWVGAQPR